MNCFEIVRQVLDELYAEIPIDDDAEKDETIVSEFKRLSILYGQLHLGAEIEYRSAVTRFAYVYCYVTTHANIVYDRIRFSKALEELFDQEQIVVSSLGGGPGSDFLGILKYMLMLGKTARLRCYLCDSQDMWDEAWVDVGTKVKAPFQTSTVFRRLGVTDPAALSHNKVLEADLFTLIYFMSEVHRQADQAQPFFDRLFAKAKPGAMILFVDNNTSKFYGWFDELAASHGMDVLESSCGTYQLGREER